MELDQPIGHPWKRSFEASREDGRDVSVPNTWGRGRENSRQILRRKTILTINSLIGAIHGEIDCRGEPIGHMEYSVAQDERVRGQNVHAVVKLGSDVVAELAPIVFVVQEGLSDLYQRPR